MWRAVREVCAILDVDIPAGMDRLAMHDKRPVYVFLEDDGHAASMVSAAVFEEAYRMWANGEGVPVTLDSIPELPMDDDLFGPSRMHGLRPDRMETDMAELARVSWAEDTGHGRRVHVLDSDGIKADADSLFWLAGDVDNEILLAVLPCGPDGTPTAAMLASRMHDNLALCMVAEGCPGMVDRSLHGPSGKVRKAMAAAAGEGFLFPIETTADMDLFMDRVADMDPSLTGKSTVSEPVLPVENGVLLLSPRQKAPESFAKDLVLAYVGHVARVLRATDVPLSPNGCLAVVKDVSGTGIDLSGRPLVKVRVTLAEACPVSGLAPGDEFDVDGPRMV